MGLLLSLCGLTTIVQSVVSNPTGAILSNPVAALPKFGIWDEGMADISPQRSPDILLPMTGRL